MSTTAERAYATDETFREVADLLFGGGVEITKANPDGFDLSAKKKKEQTQARIGLASNILGMAAGAAGLNEAAQKYKSTKAEVKGIVPKGPKHRGLGKFSRVTRRAALPLAAGAVGLQAANLAGDAVANRVLARASKEPKKKVSKEYGMSCIPLTKGALYKTGAKKAEPHVRGTATKVKQKTKQAFVHKSFIPLESDLVWEGEFSKFDMDKRQVFGWASIVKKDGEDVVDLQGDYISIDEIEKSAYAYVKNSRKGGNQHQRTGDEPLHVSDMIESFIVTPEKVEKMGLPEDTPLGWWVGYQINDEDTWQQVKTGKRTGFSIHGHGRRA